MSVDKEMLIKKIGHRLKVLRVNADLKQSELEQKTGIKQANISAYEKGTRVINVVDLFRLAEGLGCSVSDVVDFERGIV